MKQKTIVALALGLLVLISAVQAFQLSGLKEKMADGALVTSSGSASSTVTAASGNGDSKPAALPPSLKDLPTMVGGC